jgi:hypothetical protein
MVYVTLLYLKGDSYKYNKYINIFYEKYINVFNERFCKKKNISL